MPVIKIRVPDQNYDVIIRSGLLSVIQDHIHLNDSKKSRYSKIMIFADASIQTAYGGLLQSKLETKGSEVILHGFNSGESQKTVETVTQLYTKAIESGLERSHPIIALGGGVAGDVAGFVAATYLRGVPLYQVPTTLLAMVDASIGGKTGYNHPLGKNMIGAFKQPVAVLIDPHVLKTLPEREYRSGLAECIKHGLLGDWSLFEWMEENIAQIVGLEPHTLEDLIARNVRVKADVVMSDEKESGRRALLNFGHTFAHAIEVTSGYGYYTHGEAVALGNIAACRLAASLKLCPEDIPGKTIRLTEKAGLPVKGEFSPDEDLLEAMRRDKKVKDGQLRLILPTGYGSAGIFDDIDETAVVDAWTAIRKS